MKRTLCLSLLVICLFGCTSVDVSSEATEPANSRGQPTIVIEDSNSEKDLVPLMARILESRSSYIDHSQIIPEEPTIRVGDLPMDIPFSVPMMDGTEVLGSISHKNSWPYDFGIFLDVSHSAAEILKFYEDNLSKLGFTVWRIGDSESFQANEYVILCQEQDQAQLTLTAHPIPESPTDVRITYVANPAYVSCTETIPDLTTYSQQLLPEVDLPKDAVLLGSVGGGGAEGWAYSQQRIISARTPAELHNLLIPAIEQQGWEVLDESTSTNVAWSKWGLIDANQENWSGVFLITAGAGSEKVRILMFQIELVYQTQ